MDDVQAWGEFVDRYAPKIFSWCRRFCLQDSDAADVTQEVLCKLVSAMRSFEYDRKRGRFRGWLKTITSNTVRDLIARQSRARASGDTRTVKMFEMLEDESATNALAETIESAYQQELLAAAEAGVQIRVKPTTWQIYQLAAVQQLPATSVAEQLCIKISEVYVAKSRVIKMLRDEVHKIEQSW